MLGISTLVLQFSSAGWDLFTCTGIKSKSRRLVYFCWCWSLNGDLYWYKLPVFYIFSLKDVIFCAARALILIFEDRTCSHIWRNWILPCNTQDVYSFTTLEESQRVLEMRAVISLLKQLLVTSIINCLSVNLTILNTRMKPNDHI